MKKIGVLWVVLVVVVLCSSCNINQKCPAYADNSVETEQSI